MDGRELAATEAAAYAAAMDGVAALREMCGRRLLTEAMYRVHVNAVLARLDPALRLLCEPDRIPPAEETAGRRASATRTAHAPHLLKPPGPGPRDELPRQLVADAAHLLVTRRSGSAVLLCEWFSLPPETVVRVLWRLAELGVLTPAGAVGRRCPTVAPMQADAVRDRILQERRPEPAPIEDAIPSPPRDAAPVELLTAAAELVVSSQFGSSAMLQRSLRCSMAMAEQLMDELQERGIVAAQDGSRFRRVLAVPGDLAVVLAGIAGTRGPEGQWPPTSPV